MNTLFATKVIWAVDPFHEAPKKQVVAGKTVGLIFKKSPVEVEPVSILLQGRYSPRTDSFPEKWNDLAKAAEQALQELFKKEKIPGLQKFHFLRQEKGGVTSAVDALLEYALEEEAEMLVVSSHARKGMSRLILGSFAETLTLKSPIPVLVLNPRTTPHRQFKRILFPTDFSDASRKAFERVLLLAQNLDLKVQLLHKLELIHPEIGYPFLVPVVSRESIKELTFSIHEVGDKWVKYAKAMGVDASFFLSSKSGSQLDEIFKAASRSGDSTLIAMASQSGPVKSMLLGSLTRQVLRSAKNPVLVLHPEQESLVDNMLVQLKEKTEEGVRTLAMHPPMT